MDKETKRKIGITLMGVVGIVVLLIGISFAAFSSDISGVEVQGIQTGCLKVDMTDNGNLNISNAAPMTNESGLTSNPYTYTITNSCTVDASFTATLNIMSGSNLDNLSKIKVTLDGDSYLAPTMISNLTETELVDSSESSVVKTYSLDTGYLKVGESKTFDLRTWIDYDVESISGGLESKIIILSTASNNLTIDYDTNTSGYTVLSKNTILQNVSYSAISPSDNQPSGVVAVNVSDGVKYYFRGNPNNYLTFAGLDFRILSTNPDGSINIVLNDVISGSTYANIKSTLNSWYDSNISLEEKYVKTTQTYCEDTYDASGNFLAKIRVDNNNPSGECTNNSFTKVGIVTADDLMYAGAVKDTANTSFYLSSSSSYYTSSYNTPSSVYAYTSSNALGSQNITGVLGLKPVITLSSDTLVEGLGTEEQPFYVSGLYSEENNNEYSDTIVPEIVVANVDERWSKENKNIEIVAKDNSDGSGIAGYMIKTSNTAPSASDSGWEASSALEYTTVNSYDNGTYYAFVKDNAGNVSQGKEVVIDKVDKVAPSCTIRINPNGNPSPNKVLSIISDDTNIDLNGYSWDHTESIEDAVSVTANGVYTGYITDLAGNQGSCSGIVLSTEPTGADTIISKVGTDGIVAETHPETEQLGAVTDYRYTGANPNNYVSFNDELWRIIGVFPTDDGTGNIENRIKIIRNESIGVYSWDNKASGTGSSTSSLGSNDWSDSALQIVLNEGAYYNRTTGNCPRGQNGATTACDFSTTGLTEEAKSMIGEAKWYLGGTNSYTSSSNGLTSHWYTYERGTTVYSGRPTSFIGKIGLMYPSDYGYATSGGSTTSREECLAKELYIWDSSDYSDCRSNDWLYDSSDVQWTITPRTGDSRLVFHVSSTGSSGNDYAFATYAAARPVLYLDSTVEITGGTGTSSDPYILGI